MAGGSCGSSLPPRPPLRSGEGGIMSGMGCAALSPCPLPVFLVSPQGQGMCSWSCVWSCAGDRMRQGFPFNISILLVGWLVGWLCTWVACSARCGGLPDLYLIYSYIRIKARPGLVGSFLLFSFLSFSYPWLGIFQPLVPRLDVCVTFWFVSSHTQPTCLKLSTPGFLRRRAKRR